LEDRFAALAMTDLLSVWQGQSGSICAILCLTFRSKRMNFLKKLFTPRPATWGTFHYFTVKCKRCGELIEGRVNVNNEPSLEYDEKGRPYYICRKVLIGSGHCFQQIEVVFKFNVDRGVIEQHITGGEFVSS
jgi:hypothetical protein